MTTDEFKSLVARCEDVGKLDAFLDWAKVNNPTVAAIWAMKPLRGWSDQHFYAICLVALVAELQPAPAK